MKIRRTMAWLALALVLTCMSPVAMASVKAPALALNRKTITLGLTDGVNRTAQLTAQILGNSLGLDPDLIEWSSSNSDVVAVEGGLLTAQKKGNALVRAALPGAKRATCAVRVTTIRAKSLALTPAKKTLFMDADGVGTAFTLKAAIKPMTADNQVLNWRSSNERAVVVDQEGNATAVGKGAATVYCRTTDGSKLTRSCRVTVKRLPPSSMTVVPAQISVAPRGKVALTPSFAPENAFSEAVAWKSANPKVAAVSSKGVVAGVKLGTTTITCKSKSGLISKVAVTVGFEDTNVYYAAFGQINYRYSAHLEASGRDARAFERALKLSRLGHRKTEGQVYVDTTTREMKEILSGLAARYGITDNDITYVYYSGHGVDSELKKERGALLGIDGKVEVPETLFYPTEMKAILDKIPGTVVVVLDSCLSGQYITAKSATAQKADAQAFMQAFVEEFQKPAISSTVTAKGAYSLISSSTRDKYKLIMASQPMQSSWQVGPSSLFTKYLCQAAGYTELVTYATMPGDLNKDKILTLPEIHQYAYPKILAEARNAGVSQNMMVWPTKDAFPIFARLGD